MRKRRTILLLIGVPSVLLLGLLVAGAFRSREPEFEGKKLSEWVEMYPIWGSPGDRARAEAGVRGIGTNAVPFLLRWLAYEQPPWRARFNNTVNKLASRLRFRHYISDTQERRRAFASMLALMSLGPAAHGAVNKLAHVMYDPKTTTSAGCALSVLDVLVMKSGDRRLIPVLKEMLEDPNPKIREFAAHGLRKIDELTPEAP